ncbi:hypothetical protein ACFE5P_005346, partial [Escherichia coli]|nr:hypothetical protein [Escherichia coli]ELI3879070.1 hypothetical protein [Escherichia coli]
MRALCAVNGSHPENLRFWLKACPVVLRERFHQQCKCRFNWSTQQLCENMGLR